MARRWSRGIAACAVALACMAAAATTQQGSAAATPADHAVSTPLSADFWLATPAGSTFAFGTTAFGSLPGPLNQPIVTAQATGDGQGLWLVASDGGIFSFGDSHFYGSTGNLRLNKPVVGMAPTPDGKGYWLVASDGGVFSFGDASFYGSTGNVTLQQPMISMATTPDGKGYWLLAADGGVFAFGDAPFYGSAAGTSGDPVQRLVPSPRGSGYWILRQNGDAVPYGGAASHQVPTQALLFKPVTPGDKAVLFAFQQLGKPYIWGGNGPVGYDCSGLALASWSQGAGVEFARVADDQYHTAGVAVPLDSLQAGDLVFWGTSQTDWTSVYHTAIYVGGDKIVEATGDQVQLNQLGQWGSGDLMPNGRRP